MSLVLSASILLSFLAPAPQSVHSAGAGSKGKNPAELDRTGVPWSGSFRAALERARSERRLLFLMPDNFAPTENGAWSFECFRAGPLCDERVAGLLQHCFVPFYFNTFEETAAYDEQAKAFVVRVKKEFGKQEQTFAGGIPLLVMTSEGELAGELGPYMTADDVLAQLLRILEKNEAYDKPSEAEKAVQDPLVRGRLLLARADLEKAESLLKKEKSSEALLLRVKIARFGGDWKKHSKLLDDLQETELGDDYLVERAWNYLADGEIERAAKAASMVGAAAVRSDEARYLEGVARFRISRRDDDAKFRGEALEIWKTLVQSRPQGPWIYRADWAYVNALTGDAGAISGSYDGACPSLLGREFYVGPKNPDLGI